MKNNCFLPSRSFHLEEERDKLKKKNYNKFILFIYLLTEGILLNNNS